jgi:hypothetical protein
MASRGGIARADLADNLEADARVGLEADAEVDRWYSRDVSIHGWWKAIAIAGTILNACWIALLAVPGATFRYFATCTLHMSATSQSSILLGAFILTLAITLTFATDAARNGRLEWSERLGWAIGLILASPVMIPRYWWRFLRQPKEKN